VAFGLGGGRGVAVSVHVRGARRWLSVHSPFAPLLLAGLSGEGKQEWMGVREASSLFFVKCGSVCFVFPNDPLLHLAGHGGEEVGKSSLKVGWCSTGPSLEPLVIRLFTTLPPHRPLAADAIRGHRDGHTMLDGAFCVSPFLCMRIFCSSGTASKPPAQPSGFIPGWDWGGAAAVLRAIGGLQADCKNAISLRVFVVICKGLIVFSSFYGLSCKTPTAE
jgi:hypothetical protein